MKKLGIMMALVLGLGLGAGEAYAAKRLGGGKSIGAQRQSIAPKPAAAPAQQAAQPSAPQPAAAPTVQPQPRPAMSRWLAPLAGLAAGLGLAALFGHEMGSLMTALLLGLAVAFLIGFVLRRIRGPQPALQGASPYAYYGSETVAAPPPSQPMLDDDSDARRPAPRVPEGFDIEGFLRQSKRAFISMQAANDTGDFNAIRNLTTEEMFSALEGDFAAREPGIGQQVDVVTLNAELLELITEGDTHWASIQFHGMLREGASGVPIPFEEIWHLRKPVSGTSGWLLAGIRQID